ncbi:sugar kinase [Vibrio sp. F74]|uniref:sugar kinase n=1 Tax=Vibrio sp. F74 TaxID=700020 RepID=UPI0035F5C248
MKKIAIIGECMIELNGKPFGDMWQTFGGDSLNSAVYLARAAKQHIQINYVTAMGIDPLSEGMVHRWQEEGINTQFVLKDKTRQPGLYLIQLDDQGERTFLYWRNQSAARYMLQHSDFPSLATELEAMNMVYLSGISLAILSDQDRTSLLALLKTLATKGVEIAFDSNFRPALWPQNEDWKTVKDTYSELLSFCDLALVTFDDEQAIWEDDSPEDALIRLEKAGVKKAVIKLGSEGCLFKDFCQTGSEAILVATTPIETVIDTTSAGDSFNAGYLSGHLTGIKPEECCLRGHQLAGAVIQSKGAIVPLFATQAITNQFHKPTDPSV